MRVQGQAAYVLHTRPYSESSLLVDVLSRHHGRLTLIGKGVRRLRSPRRGLVLPFQPLVLSWAGKGEMPVLTHAEPAARVTALAGQARLCGFYLNELLARLLHRHDPHPDLFDLYERSLRALREEGDTEPVLRLFEKQLLRELGYALELETEAGSHRPVQPEREYEYLPQFGVRAANGGQGPTFAGSTLLALAGDSLQGEQTMRESKQLMRMMIGYYLDGRPLHSRRLFVGRTAPTEAGRGGG
jgi:DNA repair protein RecO (recombination protein O)